MTPDQLAYWLQGAFELAMLETISNPAADCIRSHIALVRVLDPHDAFCARVETAMMVGDNAERAKILMSVVASQFEHVIDPKHPKPALADAAHHSHLTRPTRPGDPVMRC